MNPLYDVEWDDDTMVLVVGREVGEFGKDPCRPLKSLLEQHPLTTAGVVVDFTRTDYFGSMMLEALRLLWTRIEEAGGKLACCNVSDIGRDVLETSRFEQICPIYADRPTAVSSVKQ